MKARFHIYIREHRTGWFTAQVLTQPSYTAHGPYLGPLLEELAEALSADLESGTLRLGAEPKHWFDGLKPHRLDLVLRAVQHERLVEVPMRFLLAQEFDEASGQCQIWVPRIGESVRVRGEAEAMAWTEEVIRGWFYLKPVTQLLQHQYERSERLDSIEVSFVENRVNRTSAARNQDQHKDETEAHPLTAYGLNRVAEARAGRLPKARFRDREVNQLVEILASSQAPCALLVGPTGVGKTAVVDAMAHRVASNRVPPQLSDADVWTIPGTRWLAGARFLGEWQARAQGIVETLSQEGGVLDLGPLGELIAARGQEVGLSPAQFLLPVLASGELPIVAETTPEGLAQAEQIAPALVRGFQRIDIRPLEVGRISQVMVHDARRLEKLLGVVIEPEAVDTALDIVTRFRDPSTLPGTGLALLEQMARHAATENKSANKASVRASHGMETFCRDSGYPASVVDPEVRLDPEAVRAFFDDRVLGQPDACRHLANLIFLVKAGLTAPDKPLGSFLFTGPTGVGKTESALALAEYLFQDRTRITRLDMSEYGYFGAAMRLVDGPRGEGDLTRAVRGQPFGIVLFDEVEKADSGVLDLLLQILGEGRLTDGTGRTVGFEQSIVILTSNLGADDRPTVGFGPGPSPEARYADAIERFFRPELVNRIDHIVPFKSLDPPTLRRLAERLLRGALEREGLVRRNLMVTATDKVLEAVQARGYEPQYGARPMKRTVEAEVVAPLARHLSGRSLAAPISIVLDWDDDEGLQIGDGSE